MSNRTPWLVAIALATATTVTEAQELPPRATLDESWVEHFDWRCVGPANMGGRIIDLAVNEADPSNYWVATASGGLLKTVNAGITFEHQFDTEEVVSIGAVAIAPSDPSIVWVGSGEYSPRNSVSYGNGVYKSTDGGDSWTHMGLDATFQIGDIKVHPTNPDVVYVGALGRLYGPNAERGLYKTTDGGKTWQHVLAIDEDTGVMDVALHPTRPDTLIVSAYERRRDGFDGNSPATRWGEAAGMYRSTDGGKTFERLTQGLPSCKIGRIGIDYYRANPEVVYAIVESEKTGQMPDDMAWTGLRGEDAEAGVRVTRVDDDSAAEEAGLKQGDIILAVGEKMVLSWDEFEEVQRAHQAGDEVELKLSRDRECVHVKMTFSGPPENARSPFAGSLNSQRENMQDQQGANGHEFGGLYRSADGGTSWTRINTINPRPMYFSRVRVDPSDENHIFICGISMARSRDGGETFTNDAGRGVHADQHCLWIDPDDGRHIILGTDGGLYVTHDRSDNWDHLNHMALGQFYHVEMGPRRDYWVYGGLQDNGTWGAPSRSPHGSGILNESWINIGGGDGFLVQVDREDPDQIYYESQNGGMGRRNLRTASRGSNRPRREEGIRTRFNWRTPFLLSEHNSRVFYTAGNYVYRSLDRGNQLKRISPEITLSDRGSGTALAESPLDSDILYVGTDDGALWMTKNGGQSWISLYSGPAEEGADIAEPVAELAPSSMQKVALIRRDDPISGTWECQLHSEFIPEGEGQVTVTMKLAENGAITGGMSSNQGDSSIQNGKYDAEKRSFSMEVAGDQGVAELKGKLDADGKMVAALIVMDGEFSLDITGKRVSTPESAEASAPAAAAAVAAPETAPEAEAPAATSATEEEAAPAADGARPLNEWIAGPRWVSGLEASRHVEGRVYLTLDGHRSDDDQPYAFVSEDHGANWTALHRGLPRGSTRCIREDRVNPNLLYLGTEFHLYASLDRGQTWFRMNSNLPTVAIHEVDQHELSGEIAVATHGRSIWILDVTPLRQMSAEALKSSAKLYAPNDVVRWRSGPRVGSTGARRFVGEGPSSVATAFYSLADKADEVKIRFEDLSGKVLREMDGSGERGLHHVSWDLRGGGETVTRGGRSFRRGGSTAEPGRYFVVLSVDGEESRQSFDVLHDPNHPESAISAELFDEEWDEDWEEIKD